VTDVGQTITLLAPPSFPHPSARRIRIVRTQEAIEVYKSSVYPHPHVSVYMTVQNCVTQ